MTRRPQAVPKRLLLGLSLAALLALVALTMLARPALPKADPGGPQIAKKKKQKKITGKLTEGGYTVIALAQDGKGKTDRAPKGTFKLRPPAKKVTLHLRAADGTYAGPIVVGQRKGGKRAIEGVYAGAKLGKVKVKPGQGYAKAKLRNKWTDQKREARAKKGVPIGAGNFGRVAVSKLKGKTSEGADRDLDGIPNTLDIDRDGDLVLDDVDAKLGGGGRATGAWTWSSLGSFGIQQVLELGDTGPGTAPIVNANAAGLSDEQIESGLRNAGLILVDVEDAFASAELNCGELVYCSAGGTGRTTRTSGIPDDQPFPECCDPDKDGFGSLQPDQPGAGGGTRIWLKTGAGADQIRGGDVLIAQSKLRGSGEQGDLVHSLNNIFVTTSALASYTDELGVTRQVSYPYSSTTPLPVVDGPDAGSDVSATLHFWRPQRRPVPDELPDGAGNWIDIGGLDYWAIPNGGEFCRRAATPSRIRT